MKNSKTKVKEWSKTKKKQEKKNVKKKSVSLMII